MTMSQRAEGANEPLRVLLLEDSAEDAELVARELRRVMPDAVNGVARLRIAHLIESDGPGGAERVVAQLATALQRAGAENIVFLPANGEGWLAKELAGAGVTARPAGLNTDWKVRSARRVWNGSVTTIAECQP